MGKTRDQRKIIYIIILIPFALVLLFFSLVLIFNFEFRKSSLPLFLFSNKPLPVVPKGIIRFHEMLGWMPSEGKKLSSEATGEQVVYRINKYGMRDEEVRLKKDLNKFRIAVFGDSYTFGYGINISEHYTTLLEKRFKDVEVLNFGVDAYGIDQSFLRFKYHGLAFQPNLVILFVPHYGGHRHMYSNRFGRNKPRFKLEKDRLDLVLPIVPMGSRKNKVFENISNDKRDQFQKALRALAEKIVFEMWRLSKEKNIDFVLVSRVDSLTEFARKENIHVVDASKTKEVQYQISKEHGHLNKMGNTLLADQIQEYIQNKSLLFISIR